jgi:acyl-CoA thioesterase-1
MDDAAELPRRGAPPGYAKTSARPYGARRRIINIVLVSLVLTLLSPAAGRADRPIKLLVLGDSLTAGYGLPSDESFPARLQAALKADKRDVAVINAGVSGDTSAGGRARIDWVLADKPDFAIVELGGNDGLRGLDPAVTDQNLDAVLTRLDQSGIPVLLAGMLAPPNLGREYGEQFKAVFPRLAEKHHARLYPFFLDGVAADPALNQGDGIHPNAKGVDVIVARIMPAVKKLLGSGPA